MLAAPILLALVLIARVAVAQGLDPKTVPLSTREYWCQQQITSCPLICLQIPGADGSPISNDCNPDVLIFHCVCSNGLTPNVSEYSQTLPYFICTQLNNICVDNCVGDLKCQTACRQDHPCGAPNPRPTNSFAVTATSATGSTGGSATVSTGLRDASTQSSIRPTTSTTSTTSPTRFQTFSSTLPSSLADSPTTSPSSTPSSSPLSTATIIGIVVSVTCSVLGLIFGVCFKIWKYRRQQPERAQQQQQQVLDQPQAKWR